MVQLHSISLTDENTPAKVDRLMDKYGLSISLLVKYCVWVQFGNNKQKSQAKAILRTWV